MITLTPDRLTLVKTGFSVKDLVHQGPGRSTPRQTVHPGGFIPHKKAVQGSAGLYSAIGRDDTYQKALYPRLSATVHMPMLVAV
jgi:hypothetical protein